MASSKQNKTDINNPIVYLVSGVLENGKELKNNTNETNQ